MGCSGICSVVGVVRRYRLLVVATVLVLQALEGLSDREAIGRLRCDIRWKAAAGLALNPSKRRAPLGTILGSNVALRSRGTSKSTAPISVNTCLASIHRWVWWLVGVNVVKCLSDLGE